MIDYVIVLAIPIISAAIFFGYRWYRNRIPAELHLGPIIGGKNWTKGTELVDKEFKFPWPNRNAGHVHALVQPIKSMMHCKRIFIKWEIVAEPGTKLHPQEHEGQRAEISLMIQRKGDDYGAKGSKEFYRLYAPGPQFLELGKGQMTAELTPSGWIGVFGTEPTAEQFLDIRRNPATMQICFGGGSSRAHGVYASAPATFKLFEFSCM